MRPTRRSFVSVVLLLVAVFLIGIGCREDSDVSSDERASAIAAAQEVYAQELERGTSFESGPCIAEEVIDDWSVDIAHDPREDVDNIPENQCQYYRDGRTHHFVELDPDGNLIRAQ